MTLLDGEALSFAEELDAYLADDSLYTARPPAASPVGRKRKNPFWVWLLYSQVLTIQRTARSVARELKTPVIWDRIIAEGKRRYPADPSMWPKDPMTRAQYEYMRNLVGDDNGLLAQHGEEADEVASSFATEMDLLTGNHGSLTSPGKADCLHADGKVIRSMFNPRKVNKKTGEVDTRRVDQDAAHIKTGGFDAEGNRKHTYGVKGVLAFARGDDPGTRLIMSVRLEEEKNETKTAIAMVRDLLPRVPGTKMLIYDGALRGTHINELMTDVGLMSMSPIDPVSGAKGSGKPRVEKEVFIEEVDVHGGTLPRVRVYAYGGAAGVMGRRANGAQFVELLELIQVRRNMNTDGTWRFYGEYKLPARLGGGNILLRHNATVEDRKRKFNRCENLRLFPNGSEQYKELYGRRSDAESSNRNLEDSLWLNRAHCLGKNRQLVTLIGYQRARNAVAIARYRALRAFNSAPVPIAA